MRECQDEERRQLTAVGRLCRLASQHRIEQVNLVDRFRWLDPVHRLCGVGPLDRLGGLSGFRLLDRLGRERRLDLVRAVPLVPPGLAVVQRYRSSRPPQARLTRQGSRSPKLLMPGPAGHPRTHLPRRACGLKPRLHGRPSLNSSGGSGRRRLTTGNSQRRPGRYSSIEDVIDVSLLSCRAEAAA